MSSTSIKILAFAGSARRESVNKRLVQAAARMIDDADVSVTVLDLADYPLPLYDGDLEESEGLPGAVDTLKGLMNAHDAFLISCPEYNGSITPLLKNLIDWCSRPSRKDEPPLQAFNGKVAGLLGASPGGLGGLRGLRHVREILGNIGVHVIPKQHALGGAFQAFDDAGSLKDDRANAGVSAVVKQLVNTTRALSTTTA